MVLLRRPKGNPDAGFASLCPGGSSGFKGCRCNPSPLDYDACSDSGACAFTSRRWNGVSYSLSAKRPPGKHAQVYNPRNMSEHIKKKLQDEINALEHELIHELPKEIKKAAALGDLSENAEYHMAKQRQEFVKARVRQLGKRLADFSLINFDNIPKDRIGLGSTVKIYDSEKAEEIVYKLVTSEEFDVAAGKISTTSPIGRALLNKKVGETAIVVTPNGKREMEILSLTTIHDEAEAAS